ncbi:unnamed protein product [Symbiodinium natans]|uniref:Uncharacterized protein n=1 Tax=Symbiodinium natans TaxID=878477 RepID=A0A812SAA3_9DINO|nr:unnamed protein product [Symbiodinium natans]
MRDRSRSRRLTLRWPSRCIRIGTMGRTWRRVPPGPSSISKKHTASCPTRRSAVPTTRRWATARAQQPRLSEAKGRVPRVDAHGCTVRSRPGGHGTRRFRSGGCGIALPSRRAQGHLSWARFSSWPVCSQFSAVFPWESCTCLTTRIGSRC